MARSPRAVRLAAGVTVLLTASLSFGADLPPPGIPNGSPEAPRTREGTAPGRPGGPKAGEARLDAVKIIGAAELPAVLFFLPRAKFRLLPLRPEADPAARMLRGDKLSADVPGS